MAAQDSNRLPRQASIQGAILSGMVHSEDGYTAVVVGRHGQMGFVGVVDLETMTVLFEVAGVEHAAYCVTRFALGPGGCCFVVGFEDGSLRVFQQNQASKALEAALSPPLPKRHETIVRRLAVNSTRRVLVSASWEDETLCLWDVDGATGAITPSALGGTGPLRNPSCVVAVAWSPTEEHLLATGCLDGHVRLFDVRAGAEAVATMGKVGECANPVYCLAFDPRDGATTIAVGYSDGHVARWDARAPHAAVGAPIKAHTGCVQCLQYSPCGRVLATGGGHSDTMVKLWDATGTELVPLADDAVLRGATHAIVGLEFNPSDPSLLLSCGWCGSVRQWYVSELDLPLEGPAPQDSPPRAATDGDDAGSGLGKRGREGDGGVAAAIARRAPAPALFGSLVMLTAALSLTVNRDPKTKQITGFIAPGSKVTISPHDARQAIHDMVVAKHGSAKACSLFH